MTSGVVKLTVGRLGCPGAFDSTTIGFRWFGIFSSRINIGLAAGIQHQQRRYEYKYLFHDL